MSFFAEIRRRKVFQVAAVYAVVAWLIIQIIDVVSEPLSLPEWLDTVVIVLLAAGFPIAVILAWAFELTPQGVVRDEGPHKQPASSRPRIEYALALLLLVAVSWIGFRELNDPGPRKEILPNSVAVLPFENLTADPANAFFAPGIHDTVLHELAKIGDLNVIARTTMLRYEDTELTIPEIASELGVETVMEGTIQYADGHVLVTVQLIDPQTESHRWSGNYDRQLADIFAVQADIARRIAAELGAELTPAELASIEDRPTDSVPAHELYLRARALGPNIGPQNAREVGGLLERAVQLDDEFALAHAALAFTYSVGLGVRTNMPMEDREILAREHANRALAIDRNQGLAYAALANIDMAYLRLADAEQHYDRALELSPNDADILGDALILFSFLGRQDRAATIATREYELNPTGYSMVWLYRGSGERALEIQALHDFMNSSPARLGEADVHGWLALAEALRGNDEAALDELQLAESLDPALNSRILARLAYTFGQLDRVQDAQRMFDRLEIESRNNIVSPIFFVWANLGVDNRDAALRALRAIADQPGPHNGPFAEISMVARNLLSNPVLEEPEFVEVRRRLGFVQ